MHTVAVILGAGSGSRMGGDIKKQYLDLSGHEILWHSLNAFENSRVDEMVLVCPDGEFERNAHYMEEFGKLTHIVSGGRERYHSVYEGLKAAKGCDLVLIHDGARPLVTNEIIDRCLETLKTEEGCVAAVISKDTVRITDADGYTASTPDRDTVRIIQTPQAFRYDLIYAAYDKLISIEESGSTPDIHITDDAMVAEYYGSMRVKMIEGSYDNIKITTPSDLIYARSVLERK